MFTHTSDQLFSEYPSRPLPIERLWKPKIELAPSCPRCASSNTKFCYYNNYNLSQPRYFCKGCKRYWTKGGSLRNVPEGGGCRKSRRAKSARSVRQSPDSDMFNKSDNETDGAEIDLAAVFANYLGQDSGNEGDKVVNDQDSSSGASYESSQGQYPYDSIGDEGFLVPVGENVENLLDLQSIAGDEIEQDMLWPNDTSLPSFAWEEAMVQYDQLGSIFTPDDMKISTDLVSDNWSMFDLSANEFFFQAPET